MSKDLVLCPLTDLISLDLIICGPLCNCFLGYQDEAVGSGYVLFKSVSGHISFSASSFSLNVIFFSWHGLMNVGFMLSG